MDIRDGDYEEVPLYDATHVLVESERFGKLTPGKLYEILGRDNENENDDNPYYIGHEPYVIDDRGKKFAGFLTIKGKYLRGKIAT